MTIFYNIFTGFTFKKVFQPILILRNYVHEQRVIYISTNSNSGMACASDRRRRSCHPLDEAGRSMDGVDVTGRVHSSPTEKHRCCSEAEARSSFRNWHQYCYLCWCRLGFWNSVKTSTEACKFSGLMTVIIILIDMDSWILSINDSQCWPYQLAL